MPSSWKKHSVSQTGFRTPVVVNGSSVTLYTPCMYALLCFFIPVPPLPPCGVLDSEGGVLERTSRGPVPGPLLPRSTWHTHNQHALVRCVQLCAYSVPRVYLHIQREHCEMFSRFNATQLSILCIQNCCPALSFAIHIKAHTQFQELF